MKNTLLLVALLCMACSASGQYEEQLSFTKANFSDERCVNGNCATVVATWPVAENTSAASKINEDIRLQLLGYINQEEIFTSMDSAARTYLDSFEDFKKDFPEAPGGWSIDLDAEITYESDSTLSIKFSEFNFSGGAHPNSSVYYMNFDKQTGEYLSRNRIILQEKKMYELAEKEFRKQREVDEGMDLKDDGRFFLPEVGFFLPNAIGYEGDKFVLTYIPYEIGPYVMGYTELEFELKELEGIVRMK